MFTTRFQAPPFPGAPPVPAVSSLKDAFEWKILVGFLWAVLVCLTGYGSLLVEDMFIATARHDVSACGSCVMYSIPLAVVAFLVAMKLRRLYLFENLAGADGKLALRVFAVCSAVCFGPLIVMGFVKLATRNPSYMIARVHQGMSSEELRSALGQPDQIDGSNDFNRPNVWSYRTPDSIVSVVLDQTEHVKQVETAPLPNE